MDSLDEFDEKLTRKIEFYSILQDEHIRDEQYIHAQNTWNTFNFKSIGQYHDLYLKSDILLLADVSPGLSCDAMLKMTDIKLELMTDIDMFQFVDNGIWGVVSHIFQTDMEMRTTSTWKTMIRMNPQTILCIWMLIIYMVMLSQHFPTSGLKWLSEKEIEKTDLGKYTDDSRKSINSQSWSHRNYVTVIMATHLLLKY